MNTFSRSWDLISESFHVIRKDKKLIVFPILSGSPARRRGAVLRSAFPARPGTPVSRQPTIDPSAYAWMFLWYCTNYFVIVFFSCALAACAQIRFSGRESRPLAPGSAQAAAKLPAL